MNDLEDESFPALAAGRVRLRPFRESDSGALIRLNADPEVMRYFPAVLGADESLAFMARNARHVQSYGFGLWALELPGIERFAGFVGLLHVGFEAPFVPAVEIGWRLGREYWGQGYVTEAARLALAFGFRDLGLDEIVSFTVPANERSWRVMERLGMVPDRDGSFEHPRLPPGHPLRRHCLYRLSRRVWQQGQA